MRNQWRLLLRHNLLSTPSRMPRSLFQHQVISLSTLSLSSLVSQLSISKNTTFPSIFHRYYSSELPINGKSPDTSLMIDIFSKPIGGDDIKKEIASNNIVVTCGLVKGVLKELRSKPDTAIKVFDWVLKREKDHLSPKVYNLMLGILVANGFVEQFWKLLDEMRNKGYGINSTSFRLALHRFREHGLQGDVEKLEGLFVKPVVEAMSSKVGKIIRSHVWDEVVEKKLKDLDVVYSSEMVKMVLEKLGNKPMKGLIFFRWVEESGLFKHDQVSYNSMAIVLGREDCIESFWSVVADMRIAGYEMETKTYVKVLERFVKRGLMADVVELYEFAMKGANQPSMQDCTFLLSKLALAKELDVDLVSRVLKAYTGKGFALEDYMIDAVLRALTTIGRATQCNEVLDAMIEVGFASSGALQSRDAQDLSSSNMKDEANEFTEKPKDQGLIPDYKAGASLIEGHCVAGDLAKACECFKMMVEKDGISYAGYPLDLLVNAYCSRQRAPEAFKILSELVNKERVQPWLTTYKTLLTKLLDQKGLQDALPVLGLMKSHGFPPFFDPLIQYISKKGTTDETLLFFKAMNVKKFASQKQVLRVFEAYYKAGRCKEAQNLLAKCPQFIRNNADVLNLFSTMKTDKLREAAAVQVL